MTTCGENFVIFMRMTVSLTNSSAYGVETTGTWSWLIFYLFYVSHFARTSFNQELRQMDSQRRSPFSSLLINGITWNGKSWTDQSLFDRHVLTGSYHNFFRIYDTDTLNDVVLQADKSAFKAKKIGGPLPGNKIMRNGPKGAFRDAMQLDALDFNKKILHASWHPRENTIAVISSFRALILASVQADAFFARSLLRTICSYTVLHDSSGTVLINLRHPSFRFSSSRNDLFFLQKPTYSTFFFIHR